MSQASSSEEPVRVKAMAQPRQGGLQEAEAGMGGEDRQPRGGGAAGAAAPSTAYGDVNAAFFSIEEEGAGSERQQAGLPSAAHAPAGSGSPVYTRDRAAGFGAAGKLPVDTSPAAGDERCPQEGGEYEAKPTLGQGDNAVYFHDPLGLGLREPGGSSATDGHGRQRPPARLPPAGGASSDPDPGRVVPGRHPEAPLPPTEGLLDAAGREEPQLDQDDAGFTRPMRIGGSGIDRTSTPTATPSANATVGDAMLPLVPGVGDGAAQPSPAQPQATMEQDMPPPSAEAKHGDPLLASAVMGGHGALAAVPHGAPVASRNEGAHLAPTALEDMPHAAPPANTMPRVVLGGAGPGSAPGALCHAKQLIGGMLPPSAYAAHGDMMPAAVQQHTTDADIGVLAQHDYAAAPSAEAAQGDPMSAAILQSLTEKELLAPNFSPPATAAANHGNRAGSRLQRDVQGSAFRTVEAGGAVAGGEAAGAAVHTAGPGLADADASILSPTMAAEHAAMRAVASPAAAAVPPAARPRSPVAAIISDTDGDLGPTGGQAPAGPRDVPRQPSAKIDPNAGASAAAAGAAVESQPGLQSAGEDTAPPKRW